MSENVNCEIYKENLKLFQTKLIHVVTQITSDTSLNHTEAYLELKNLLELQLRLLQKQARKTIFKFVNDMWEQMEIGTKMEYLNQLKKEYPEDFVAWRPTAGEIPIKTIKGTYLTNTKERLLYKIHKSNEELEDLRRMHEIKLNALKNLLEKVNKGEQFLSNLYHECENNVKQKQM